MHQNYGNKEKKIFGLTKTSYMYYNKNNLNYIEKNTYKFVRVPQLDFYQHS